MKILPFLILLTAGFVVSGHAQLPRQSVIEGKLIAVSSFPSPKTSDYADCLFSTRFVIEKVLVGVPIGGTIRLLMPAFLKRQIVDGNLQVGDRLQIAVQPFSFVAGPVQKIQQADSLFDLEYETYYGRGAVRLNVAQAAAITPAPIFQHKSPFEAPVNPPVSAEFERLAKIGIERELAMINRRIGNVVAQRESINARFSADWARRQADFGEVKGYKWSRVGKTLMALSSNYALIPEAWQAKPENIDAIVAFRDFLHAHGTQLIIQLIPSMHAVASRVFLPEYAQYPDLECAFAAKQLLERGVETIYASDELVRRAPNYEFMFFYPKNNHPAHGCQDVLTDLSCARLKQRFGTLPSNLAPDRFSIVRASGVYGSNYRYPVGVDIGTKAPNKAVLTESVRYAGGQVPFNPNSPIQVLGSSYIQTPTPGGSYSSLLAMKTAVAPDNVRVSGHGPNTTIPLRFYYQKGRPLKGKKVCVLPVSINVVAKSRWVNLRDLDDMLRLLSGKRDVFRAPKLPAFSSAIRPVFPDEHRSSWQQFVGSQKGAGYLMFAAPDQDYPVTNFAIPERLRESPSVVYLKVATAPRQIGSLAINGVRKPLEITNYAVAWQTIVVPIEAGTEHVAISARFNKSKSALAVERIAICQ